MAGKNFLLILTLTTLMITGVFFYFVRGINSETLQLWLETTGIWTPIFFMVVYTVLTLLILPTTPLNLAGGVIFGPWLGLLWTSLASIASALIGFAFTRTYGRKLIAHRLVGYWQAMDAEIAHGGLFYIFAIRLLPIIPCGIVNLAAGLTAVTFKDYSLGTILGTIPGLFPFILLGSTGVKAIQTGEILPLLGAFTLSGLLVGVATWYRRRRRLPTQVAAKINSQR